MTEISEYFSFPVNGFEDVAEGTSPEGRTQSKLLQDKVCAYCNDKFNTRDLDCKLCADCVSAEKYFSFPVNGAGLAEAAKAEGLDSGTPLALLINKVSDFIAKALNW